MNAKLSALLQTLALSVSDEQVRQLAAYMALLKKWNQVYNLTALREEAQMFTLHLADCLAAVPLMQRFLPPVAGGGVQVLDVGSGGGLPGVVLAILWPQVTVHCVDTVGKKAAFIAQVAAQLGLKNLKAHHARVENLKAQDLGEMQIITCRAFAALPDFVKWTAHLLAPNGVWLGMKGQDPEQEIQSLPSGVVWQQTLALQVPDLEAQRCLVVMKKAEQKTGLAHA